MLKATLRTLKWSLWLGWQIESNWSDLRLFLLYMVVKPVCGSMMLLCMFYAARGVTGGRIPLEFLPFIYISNACYGLVGTVMFGMSSVVITDRESYRMLKYIFISPALFPVYFLGRGLARCFEGMIGAAVTISLGLLVPDLRAAFSPAGPDCAWLLAYLAVGAVMLWSAGMLLAATALTVSRSGMFLSDVLSGVIYFLSGVVFPITILPAAFRAIGSVLPTTYWLEGMRRSILGGAGRGPTPDPFAHWTNWELLGVLLLSTTLFVGLALAWYRRCVRYAWERGKIDEATGL